MEQKILDELLLFLKETECDTFYSIEKDINNKSVIFKDIDSKTLLSALLKLVKDDYVSENYRDIGPLSGYTYNISFDGLFFINNGGYHKAFLEAQRKENDYELLKNEQRKQSASLVRLNRWMVFGAIVVAIDSILNILHFFGIYFDTSNFLFCIKPT